MKIGFIGTGVMGRPMAINLQKNNHQVYAYNRSIEKTNGLQDHNIIVCTNIIDTIIDMDIIITMVGYPKDVDSVYNIILDNASPNTICIDMTTSSPSIASNIYLKGLSKNIFVLDAPVSGGDIGAINGTLSIMVGGDINIYNKALPILKCLGTTINYMGKAGYGQHTKMANQIAISGCIASLSEVYTYCKDFDLDLNNVYNAISKGAAGSWQMDNNFTKMIIDDNNPGFYIKHFIKDLKIANEESNSKFTILNEVIKMYEELDLDNLGTQAISNYYLSKKTN